MIKNDWEILDSGIKSASEHMQMDSLLLQDLNKHQKPVLHFYEFENFAATYGYFVKPEKYLHLENAKKRGVELARRPTGGGIVFHLTDLAFSLLLPSSHPGFSLNTMNNYAFINAVVKKAIAEMIEKQNEVQLLSQETEEVVNEASYFCMAKPTKYDVTIDGKKVGGAAIRLTKAGLLYQGTIALGLPSVDFLREILLSADVIDCMKKNSCLLLQGKGEIADTKKHLKHLLTNVFCSI